MEITARSNAFPFKLLSLRVKYTSFFGHKFSTAAETFIPNRSAMVPAKKSNEPVAINEYKNYECAFNHFNDALNATRLDAIAKLAQEHGDIFNVEPSFFYYALDFGLEVATEYWVNTRHDLNQEFMNNIQKAFAKIDEEKEIMVNE